MVGNWKLVIGICLVIVSCFLVILAGGCGERTESTSYYYGPSWTNDGKIIFIKGLSSVRKDFIGSELGSSYTETVMIMTAAGADETMMFDATGAPPYAMSCSPTRPYVAYMDQKRGDEFGLIVIRTISTEASTSMKLVETSFSPRIRSFDWSPDGNRIVYCTSQEVRVRNWDDYVGTTDNLVVTQAGLSFVSWQYGTKIAFVSEQTTGKVLSLISPSGMGRVDLAVSVSVDKPQISSADTDKVYGIAGGSYCVADVSGGTPTRTEVRANFKGDLPRLSPSAAKAVYSKVNEDSGIYLLDVASGAESRLKP